MLWSLAIQMHLDIPAKDFQYYRVVLIVTDIFNRRHLKDLANIILNRLGFSSIILHQVMLYNLILQHCKYQAISQLQSACSFHTSFIKV